MRVVIDEKKCSGYASCELAAPEVFKLGARGVVEALDPAPPATMKATVEAAVRSCPTRAISVVED